MTMGAGNRFTGASEAKTVDFGALGAAMSGLRGGFSESGPVHFSPAPEPKHFRPANPGSNPTEGWDPFDPLSENGATAPQTHDPITAARSEGFTEGMATAERMAAERGEADAQALAEIAGLLQLMSTFDRDALANRLRQTVMFLVTRLVGEAGVSAELLTKRIEAATALIADSSELGQLRLNPVDLALVEGHQPERVTLVPDETIGRGGFRIETRTSTIEDGPANWIEQLGAALDRTALPGE